MESKSGVKDSDGLKVAWFVSAHGFGHAARASAVMAALKTVDENIHFDIFSTVPPWFFTDSVGGNCHFHEVFTDIGFVQNSPFQEDIPKTLDILDTRLPFDPNWIRELAGRIMKVGSHLVICDIAPIGIAAARQARVPSVLIENFTWDRIYEGYLAENERFRPHMDYLRQINRTVDYHVQVRPMIRQDPSCDFTADPVGRTSRETRSETRNRLQIPDDQKCVLLTTGGITARFDFMDRLLKNRETVFIIPGTARKTTVQENLILLPHNSCFYHPDLINAADAVIGKVGYSTLAEVFLSGKPFGYVPRKRFPESECLVDYIRDHMQGISISEDDFNSGKWTDQIEALCKMPSKPYQGQNGADQVAAFLIRLMNP